jgi:LuxR family maltose regulon positive regulatory protein
LRQRDSIDLFPARLGGGVPYVTEYLATEILKEQPPAVQAYLLRTSLLDRFCAPLCQAVCLGCADLSTPEGGAALDGQAFLELLARRNLFVIPLDDERTWYRYHHMLRELLQDELRRRLSAGEIAALHCRASAWLAEHGLVEEALHHALAAGDTGIAARLVAEHRHRAMNQEQWHRLRRWLGLLPREVVEGDPQLLIVEAWLLIGWAEMAPVAERVGALLANLDPKSPDTINLQAEFDTLHSLIAYHVTDGPQCLALARRALERLPREYASERGLAVMLKSMAYQMIGDLASARAVVWEALAEKAAHHPTYQARVRMTSCFVDAIAAELDGVLGSAGQVLKLGQELNLAESIAHGYYFTGLCHYERNELDRAERSLLPVVRGAYIANLHNFTFSSFLLALCYQAQDRPAEAREAVETVVERAVDMGDVSLLQTARAFQSELALRQGNVASAHLWARTYSPEPLHVAYRFYVPQITLPRVLLALGTPDSRRQAADVLVRLHDFFASTHNVRLLIEVLALQALRHDACGDEPAALAALERALALSEPGDFIRLYVDLGPRMAGLLEQLRGQGVAPGYIARILVAFGTTAGGHPVRGQQTTTGPLVLDARSSSVVRRPSSPPVEPLTRRESEVLALLAQGLSNKEIAEQLVLATGSVKQYTHRIYQKLGVKNRRQAVRTARDLEILPPL